MLYFFGTAERPFGDPVRLREWRRRLYRQALPPRALREDFPPWLQEVVLRCLEVDPSERHPTAAQLAFDLRHPEQIALTSRAMRRKPEKVVQPLRRWLGMMRSAPIGARPLPPPKAPIVMAAVDLSAEAEPLGDALRLAIGRILRTEPAARLACVNVLKMSRLRLDDFEDPQGRNLHLQRLAQLKRWAHSLPLPADAVTYHVFESPDTAGALIDYASANHVDHIIIGARSSSTLRRYLGSVSSRVVAEAPCTVTVVRVRDG